MHPRNRYRDNRPDFLDLARHRPSLMPFLIRKKARSSSTEPTPYSHTVDFSNPEALRELACALLSRDYGLEVELPPDRLVPMVPQRLNYIHWLEDLLSETREKEEEKEERVLGIDIGTGASCIYPLLGVALNNNWHFLATETDSVSVQSATDNVSRNNLQNKISVLEVSQDTVLLGAVSDSEKYDFVMCNPPFYADQKERFEGVQRTERRPAPPTFNTGTAGETVAEGGEVGFIKRIIKDSLVLRNKIIWYTSMLGKKASLKEIRQELRKHQVPIVRSTQFVQGKTHRWAVAWSYDSTLPLSSSASASSQGISRQLHGKEEEEEEEGRVRKQNLTLFLVLTVTVRKTENNPLEGVLQWLKTQLNHLQIEYEELSEEEEEEEDGRKGYKLECIAKKNTWSHQRKKRRLKQKLQQISRGKTNPDKGADVRLKGGVENEEKRSGTETTCSAEEMKKSGKVADKTFTSSTSEGSTEPRSCSDVSATEESDRHSETKKTKEEEDIEEEEEDIEEEDILQQIKALDSPCRAEFTCSLAYRRLSQVEKEEENEGYLYPSPSKKLKVSEAEEEEEKAEEKEVLLTFEWVRGDSKDLLNQIVQYLKNRNKT